ncbi:MAG TPA: biosynthetic-type acetolactate synthase large subunit [Leptospiraceae bacterium]|nr:acetolactate synthase, large subunit, biosynthetic type [Spirochaetaceae bacterium]HBS06861.1 biosynthetic-type acetolactate synthase large subunit [Leptospiraceae bacterium]|tara:strand:+ start:18320 stop:20146 length:1827 start_codon:yes stop_codon:yes gene_type:complete
MTEGTLQKSRTDSEKAVRSETSASFGVAASTIDPKDRPTGAELVVQFLKKKEIPWVAGMPGGAILPIYDALHGSGLRHILIRHEQSAAFMAQGLYRSTGKVAACFVTSGPGATNIITSVADAMRDSIPLLVIAGQVDRSLKGTDAFQEVPITDMLSPMVKKAYYVDRASRLPYILEAAYQKMLDGRPGPVLIDIPKDIQLASISLAPSQSEAIRRAAAWIRSCQRPIIYAGGGAKSAQDLIRSFANTYGIPVVQSLMGLGCLPHGDPLNLGMIGMHGSAATNRIVQESDLMIALGVRFDDRATGNVKSFASEARIIHADIHWPEFGKNVAVDLPLAMDGREFLVELSEALKEEGLPEFKRGTVLGSVALDRYSGWNRLRHEIQSKSRDESDEPAIFGVRGDIRHFFRKVSSLSRFGPVTTDVGQHQMWVAQYYPFQRMGQLLTSGGLGTMGFGLPAALGASLGNPESFITCITGDGSILMNIQELATLKDLEANVKIIVLDNGHLGLVHQQQTLFFQERYSQERFAGNPDFAALARSFGIQSMSVSPEIAEGNGKCYSRNLPADVSKGLDWLYSFSGPALLHLMIDHKEQVMPMVGPGKSNSEPLRKK